VLEGPELRVVLAEAELLCEVAGVPVSVELGDDVLEAAALCVILAEGDADTLDELLLEAIGLSVPSEVDVEVTIEVCEAAADELIESEPEELSDTWGVALVEGDAAVLALPSSVADMEPLALGLELRVTVIDSVLVGALVSLALAEGDTLHVSTTDDVWLTLGLPVEDGDREPVRVAERERVGVEETLGLRDPAGERVLRPEAEGDLELLGERVPVTLAVEVRLLVVESLKLCVAVVVDDSDAAGEGEVDTDAEEEPLAERLPESEGLAVTDSLREGASVAVAVQVRTRVAVEVCED
jgi:hypothetical protein